jgi:peptide/nickel transport system permease protein
MLRYLRKRLLLYIPTLLAVSFITFFLGYLAPGSPIDILVGQHADVETKRRLEHEYGLDRPPLVQYGSYIAGAVRGDLGRSFSNASRPVSQMIAEQFPVTAQIAVLALLMSILLGIPAGMLAALRHNTWIDRLSMAVVVACVSLPGFVLAPLLMLLFALKLGWLPSSGFDGPEYYVLPVLVLGVRPSAMLARQMRASMLEVMQQDYIRTAYAKGLSPARVVWKHAFKNAMLPVITAVGNSFGYLLTGSFVVENIFNVPGIGYESVQSILRRDYPVIQGVALLVAAIFLTVNLCVDLLYAKIDPRVRLEEAH